MSRHRPFADGAGYTRHCWECVNARYWVQVTTIDDWDAICDIDGHTVRKYDSPNNPYSHTGTRCRYGTEDQ